MRGKVGAFQIIGSMINQYISYTTQFLVDIINIRATHFKWVSKYIPRYFILLTDFIESCLFFSTMGSDLKQHMKCETYNFPFVEFKNIIQINIEKYRPHYSSLR